jgi:hypothetical protein
MINDLYPVPDWQLLIQSKRPVIFDVGCNDGGHSRMFPLKLSTKQFCVGFPGVMKLI